MSTPERQINPPDDWWTDEELKRATMDHLPRFILEQLDYLPPTAPNQFTNTIAEREAYAQQLADLLRQGDYLEFGLVVGRNALIGVEEEVSDLGPEDLE